MRCGYVAVLGSLVNFLVGEEVAIVSHRQQTTRNQILGILTEKDFQIIFIDTPGVHHSKNNLDRFMNKTVRNAIAGADVVLYLFDGTKEIDEEEKQYIENLRGKCENLLLVETKSDKKTIEKDIKPEFCVSVVTGENIEKLKNQIVKLLPNQEAIFQADEYTDKGVAFLISEKIRGLLLESLDKEVPHGVAIVVSNFEERANLTNIDVEIICEREQHKGIIIGKGGVNLKKIGEKARLFAENLLGVKCNIKLFVKVDKDWREKNVAKYYN